MTQVFFNSIKRTGLVIGFVLTTVIVGAALEAKDGTIFTVLVAPLMALFLKWIYKKAVSMNA